MDMMEKVKQFIAAFASLTAVLYASGYLVEYAHDRMLGISVLKFTKEDLLISGGRFVLANLYELYTSFFPNFLFFLVFVVLVVFILKLEKANGDQLSGPYFIFIFVLLAGLLLGAVPYFMVPFGIADLLHGVQPVAHYSHLEAVTAKVWAAVTTDTHASRVDLSVFYIRSLLAAGLSFFLLFSLLRCRRKWKNRPLSPPGEVPAGDVREPKPELGFWKRFNLFFAKRLEPLSPYVYGIFILTASVAVAVQAVSLPVNFGILLKPNVYPEVKVEAVHLLPDDCDKKKATKIWFLRGSDKRVLFYVGYYPSGAVGPRYAMTSILKEHIDRVEITGHSFVIQASKFIK